MSVRETIKNFNSQLLYEPVIENADKLFSVRKYIVTGMGGSHLAADILKSLKPELEIAVHSDYGLPDIPEGQPGDSLVVASSYSGNTEEPIDGFKTALEKKFPVAAISVGGKILELARSSGVPYIKIPDTGIQPRMALGFSLKALLKLAGDEIMLEEFKNMASRFDPMSFEDEGRALASRLKGYVPVIYASGKNRSVAYNWKTKFNETGKIPAFYNIFPELNHNEMTGFDVKDGTVGLSEKFCFLILRDQEDDGRVLKRMDTAERMYRNRGLQTEVIEMKSRTRLEKIFSSILLADWASLYTAEGYGVESEQVPMVEEFKKLISG